VNNYDRVSAADAEATIAEQVRGRRRAIAEIEGMIADNDALMSNAGLMEDPQSAMEARAARDELARRHRIAIFLLAETESRQKALQDAANGIRI